VGESGGESTSLISMTSTSVSEAFSGDEGFFDEGDDDLPVGDRGRKCVDECNEGDENKQLCDV
jgi:hypothetical protein